MPSAITGSGSAAPGRPGLRAAAPFVAVSFLGVLSALVPPYNDGADVEPALVGGLFAVALGLLWVSIHRDHRTWVDPAGPLLFFAVLAMARDLTGGASSELAALVALPIVWLALHGTRRDLVLSTLATAATFLLPIIVIGGADYPATDWRRAVLWTGFAAFIAPVIQGVVRQLATETLTERATSAELDGVMRGAHLTSIITTDPQGTIRSFSSGATTLLGYLPDDVVERRGPGLFHDPDEVAAVAAELGVDPGFTVFAELARRQEPSRVWTYVRSDGQRLFVRLAITELRDHDGTLTGYLGVAIDATPSVRAERALAVSEQRWRVLLENLPDITVVMIDEEMVVVAVAGTGAMRQGLLGSEGHHLSTVSNPANMVILSDLVSRAVAGEEVTGELRGSRTGDEHELVVTPLPPEAGRGRALILARDVSRERARERSIVAARDRAERLFSDAPHGVAVTTVDGILSQANAALATMLGRTADDLVGTAIGDLSSDSAVGTQASSHLADALAHRGQRVEAELTMVDAAGGTIHVVMSSRVLVGLDGADDLVLSHIVDVSERRRFEQRLAHLADHDPLTGLVNRRRFNDELQRHLERCERYGSVGAVLLLDLDHFKEVNDTLGHNAGDELIVSTAALLRSGVRGSDVVGRLGGDEFAILLTEADLDAASTVAAAIVDRIQAFTQTLDGTRRRVTASIGVVTMKAARDRGEDVLALADMTMYDAKDAGRSRFAVLDETSSQQPRSGARLEWKSRIERALENDTFTLHLQPIMDLQTNRVGSAETLLRLDDSDELILPSRFLYIAERSGLAHLLDAWVIRRSIAMLADLQRFRPTFTMEVNLSGQSIGDPAIEDAIVRALDEHQVDPSTVILEITETAAVADVETARQFAERMTAMGCKFALDDFGAGFGSFYYLKHLLFDYVKIDGEFVTNCHRSDVDRSILRSIVGIAHDLGKEAIAEFVAEPATLDIVRAEGVDLAQGFLIGKPVPYEEFVATYLDPVRETALPSRDH